MGARFEDEVEIVLVCCERPMVLKGNLSLRGVSGKTTRLGYECAFCFRRVMVTDAWDEPSREMLAEVDQVE